MVGRLEYDYFRVFKRLKCVTREQSAGADIRAPVPWDQCTEWHCQGWRHTILLQVSLRSKLLSGHEHCFHLPIPDISHLIKQYVKYTCTYSDRSKALFCSQTARTAQRIDAHTLPHPNTLHAHPPLCSTPPISSTLRLANSGSRESKSISVLDRPKVLRRTTSPSAAYGAILRHNLHM